MTYKKTLVIGFAFSGLILLIALATYYISLGECSSGYLACDNGKCIPQKLICNFNRDCLDGKDENRTMCGNFYGSNIVIRSNDNEGKKIFEERLAFYKLTPKQYDRKCILEEDKIPQGCYCVALFQINCKDSNRTSIPQTFPTNVVRILLNNNRINLDSSDIQIFGAYGNLTYLDLSNNTITQIPSRIILNNVELRKLFLQYNRIKKLPDDLFETTILLRWLLLNHNLIEDFNLNIFANLTNLQLLKLDFNKLTLRKMYFPELPALNELFLDNNYITDITKEHLVDLKNLTLISLRHNLIQSIDASTFTHLSELIDLRLSGNPITNLDSGAFLNLKKLNALYLDDIFADINYNMLSTLNVSLLSLRGIPYDRINFNAIEKIEKLEHIVYKKFVYCSNTAFVKKCYPKTDGISSTSDLLEKRSLRYSVWIMAILTCVGNASVLWGRLHDENRSVSLVIRNLAISDMIMGFYLIIIGYMDARFRNVYHENSGNWVKSWECALSGMLAMTSCEVSILILTFMSIERFLLISDPFGHHKLDTKNVIFCLYVIWLVGCAIAIFPVILFHSSTKFYGVYNSGTCFPFFIEEVYSTGWIYSACIFLGINFILLVLIAVLYTSLLFSIFRTRRATSLNFFDCEFAIRFFFIVLTDVSCWAPVIVLKLLAFYNVEISGDVYSWLVVFVLPLNSAINPILFTYTTPKYRDQIFSAFMKQKDLKKQESSSNQITADESQTKVSLLYNSNGSISKWKFFTK